jgi:anti-sigma-K factor RskA
MDRERFEDLKDAYVLGAVPEEERLEFEQYVAAHPELQAEVEELAAVAGLLAFSPREQEPAPELRRRIMDTVEAEAVQPPRASHRRSWLAGLWEAVGVRDLALGAAAILVVGLFSWSMLLQGEVRDLQGRVQSLQGQVQDQSQGPQMIALGGAGTEQGAQGAVGHPRGRSSGAGGREHAPRARGQDLPDMGHKGRHAPTERRLRAQGDSIAAVVEKPVEGADAVAVTLEPDGGSPKPTTEPMLVGEVKA